jgi:transcriptional regulator with XRE-family HTH domain
MSVKSPDKVDVEVGQRIRALRQDAGLSQTQLADELGLTFQQVQKYEKGVNRVGAGRITKIAQVLGVPVNQVITDEPTARKGAQDVESPLGLLSKPGALALLRAYGKLKEGTLRRAVVSLVENVAYRSPKKGKRG